MDIVNDKSVCCPDCGCEEYSNMVVAGDDLRVCAVCDLQWYTSVEYPPPYKSVWKKKE